MKVYTVFRTTTGKKGTEPITEVVQLFKSHEQASAYLMGLWDNPKFDRAGPHNCAVFDGSYRAYIVKLRKVKYTLVEYNAVHGFNFPLSW